MADAQRAYLPAAGRDWALSLYDPVLAAIGGNAARWRLVEQAGLRPAHRILDVGCGTGTLLVQIARRFPGIGATGIDPAPRALARAARKAAARGLAIRFDRGFGEALPYPDAAFDRVLSSFMLHHLASASEKQSTLREMRRVLAPGGSLHLLDFTHDHDEGGLFQRLHGNHPIEDSTEHRAIDLLRAAGFQAVVADRGRMVRVFRTAYYRAAAHEN
jgi:ubiquinone/menaquinone biosynthesis C-methylase UbiE